MENIDEFDDREEMEVIHRQHSFHKHKGKVEGCLDCED